MLDERSENSITEGKRFFERPVLLASELVGKLILLRREVTQAWVVFTSGSRPKTQRVTQLSDGSSADPQDQTEPIVFVGFRF